MRPWFGAAADWPSREAPGATPSPGAGAGGGRPPAPPRPLTQNMVKVLEALVALDDAAQERDRARGYTAEPGLATFTPARVAIAAGFTSGQDGGRSGHDGRRMSEAQRVIRPMTVLESRGLIRWGRRTDGLSGSAYAITEAGRRALADLENGGTT